MALTDKLTAIGDAIRAKTGSAALIPLSDMPGEIDAVYEKGVEDGKYAEWNAFWDAFQIRGEKLRTSYEYGFQAWRGSSFKPKYDLVLSGQYNTMTFRQAQGFDLYDMTVGRGVAFDTSGATKLNAVFNQSAIGKIPPLDLSSCASMLSTFANMAREYGFVTTAITLKNVREDCTFNNTFKDAPYFENITITGTIGQNGFDVRSCTKLSKASIESIINALSNKATGKTLTLSETAVIRELVEKHNVKLSAKPNGDGYYEVNLPFDPVGNRFLVFSVPTDVRIWGGHYDEETGDSIYEIVEEKSGVNRVYVGGSSEYDGYYDVEIKRTDGKELSEDDVFAIDYDYLGYEWDTLVASKPKWNIVLA